MATVGHGADLVAVGVRDGRPEVVGVELVQLEEALRCVIEDVEELGCDYVVDAKEGGLGGGVALPHGDHILGGKLEEEVPLVQELHPPQLKGHKLVVVHVEVGHGGLALRGAGLLGLAQKATEEPVLEGGVPLLQPRVVGMEAVAHGCHVALGVVHLGEYQGVIGVTEATNLLEWEESAVARLEEVHCLVLDGEDGQCGVAQGHPLVVGEVDLVQLEGAGVGDAAQPHVNHV